MTDFLDIRHIYLFQFKGTRKYKIGISKNHKYRLQRVDDDTYRKAIYKTSRKVIFAELTEEKLHRIFTSKRFTLPDSQMVTGKDAGKTEWFKLTWFQVQYVRLLFLFYGFIYHIFRFTILVVILAVILALVSSIV